MNKRQRRTPAAPAPIRAVKAQPAPGHLGPEGLDLWRRTLETHEVVDAHHVNLLRLACEALDRAEQARAIVSAEGLVATDRFGQKVPHPATKLERDSRAAFASLIRQLDLDGEPNPQYRR